MLSFYHFFISISTLPVKSRIAFKIIILTYKALHNQAPSNLRYVIVSSHPNRALHSCLLPCSCFSVSLYLHPGSCLFIMRLCNAMCFSPGFYFEVKQEMSVLLVI